MFDLPHVASRVFGTPLMIARAKLEVILGVLARGSPEAQWNRSRRKPIRRLNVPSVRVTRATSAFGEHWRRLMVRVLRLNGKRGGLAEMGEPVASLKPNYNSRPITR
jgi:hypothetical protein